jgi:hypothetical protein
VAGMYAVNMLFDITFNVKGPTIFSLLNWRLQYRGNLVADEKKSDKFERTEQE